jgi:uncharacterized surface protein with fasciclin (FAS1) repeats
MTKLLIALAAVAALATGGAAATAAPAAPAAPKSNIVQTAASAGQFKTLIALAKAAGLAGTLSTKTLTVFAPTDAAFAKVPKATLMSLQKDKAALRRVLLYHVVAGRVPSSKAAMLTSAKTLAGPSLKIARSGSALTIGGAKVVKPDVNARNGVIHVIDRVLIPPAA